VNSGHMKRPAAGRTFAARRRALRKARMVTRMLQGTMGLEGQGLDRATRRTMTKRTATELLSAGG
jgi:hypothetical protein